MNEEIKSMLNTVMLDPDKCKGCITCMKRCPTEAIRVRNGKAKVLYERCVACGECVRLCPHQAKLASFDSFDVINNYKYKIAVVAPALYGQFNNLDDINIILNGLLQIGFDDVFEVSRAAELVTAAITGIGNVSSLRKTSFPFFPKASPCSFVKVDISPISAPATKDFSPAPVKIRQRISSKFTASKVASNSSNT